ncbi:DUF3159 domain-containing protein [Tsukamurella sp. 8F]|uniref:DUF3159 domain-containing protein n=1 Tax=unclassified Tsukamurella TaxID=2633480 RepID=UPI0023B9425B|nr:MULTISPECIES: DUF3159 domain-containing protein [unclassified Tsukamurella]MDF0528898.1 DUF3159 domain-containing protein [Tsukamurella sp. 8J]MDF0586733.1 DUF3159 domain-containing protein [Tsukamurella sp. 8F]
MARPGARPPRATAWEHVGGLSGLVQSAIPSTVFVVVHSAAGMTHAIVAAIACAAALVVIRALRRLTLRPAIGSVVGVAVSSVIAYRSGDPRDYFLPDIWGYTACAAAMAASIAVRWPLAGVLWHAMSGTGMRWRSDRRVLFAYSVATATAAAAFATRAGAQIWFYEHDQAGAMVVARLALNYPLWAVTLAVWAWSIRRERNLS